MKKPTQYLSRPCPTCGHPERVINGGWLRHLRETAGLTQRAFGARVAMSSPHLSDIERNRRDCPPALQAAYESLQSRH